MGRGLGEIIKNFVKQHDDPVTFWTNEDVVRNDPLLSVVAIDHLIVSGSSAPEETTFFTAGDASSGKCNRLTDKNLEREVLIERTSFTFRLDLVDIFFVLIHVM